MYFVTARQHKEKWYGYVFSRSMPTNNVPVHEVSVHVCKEPEELRESAVSAAEAWCKGRGVEYKLAPV